MLRDAGALPAAASEQGRALQRGAELVERWPGLKPADQALTLRAMLRRVELHPERLVLEVDPQGLARVVLAQAGVGEASPPEQEGIGREPAPLLISVSARLRRSGKEVALVVGGGEKAERGSTPLAKLLSKAHGLTRTITSGEVSDLDALARREGVGRTYLIRLLRLAYLAPEIVERVIAGREPAGLTVNRLMKDVELPLAWAEQRRVLTLG